MKLTTVLSMIGALALSACKDDPLPSFAFDKCDGSESFQNLRPSLCGKSKRKGMNMVIGVGVHGTNLIAEITNYEVGTKISSGSIKPRSQGDLVTVPLGDKLGSMTLDQIKGRELVDLGVKLTIDSPRYASATLPLPPMSIVGVLQDTETAERLLVTDKLGLGASPPAKHSTYFAHRGYVVGDATSLAEIDWVALPTFKEINESEKCHYETDKGQPVNIAKSVEVYTVKLVDRRTGNVIETRDFRAIGECPGFTSAHTIRVDFNFDSWKAIETWITEKMAST